MLPNWIHSGKSLRAFPVFAAAMLLLAQANFALGDETLAERRARLEQMEESQKEQLLQNYQRFVRMDSAERERMRKLHGELVTAEDQDELRVVMQRYNDWLNELPPSQRAEITSASPEERLKKIEELRSAQQKQEKYRLGAADTEAMRNWIHANQFDVKWRTGWRDGPDKPQVTLEQLAELRTVLSEDGKAKLDEAIAQDVKAKPNTKKTHEAVRRLLFTWAGQTSRRGGPGGRSDSGRPGMRQPSEQELQDFLKNELRDRERADLLSLPHEEMQIQLRRLWGAREFRRMHDDRQRSGQSGPPGGGPPGGPNDDRSKRNFDKSGDRPYPRRPQEGRSPNKSSDDMPDEKSREKSDTEKSDKNRAEQR